MYIYISNVKCIEKRKVQATLMYYITTRSEHCDVIELKIVNKVSYANPTCSNSYQTINKDPTSCNTYISDAQHEILEALRLWSMFEKAFSPKG